MATRFDLLSECMLLSLLEYLDGTSLYQLSRVDSRFQERVLVSSLWKNIEARDEPNDEEKINFILDRVSSKTETLLMKGKLVYPRISGIIQAKVFENLRILALENQFISQHESLADFPPTLVELSFKNSIFDLSSEFFRKSYESMINLKVLILDGCLHVNPSTFVSVSKYPNLEILSCYKCPIENSIACFSVAVSNGFKNLKVFDVRLSGLGNVFLKSFMKRSNIVVLYFQNCDKSYEADFKNRVAEVRASNIPVPNVTFNTLYSSGSEDTLVTDMGTYEFIRITPIDGEYELPKSILYNYPYPPCTCGYKLKTNEGQERTPQGEVFDAARLLAGSNRERKLVKIIDKDRNMILSDSMEDWDMDSEGEARNDDTEEAQSDNNESTQGQGTSRSSASDDNSLSDHKDQNPSHARTEIIYTVRSKKTTKDQAVGTDTMESPKATKKTVPSDTDGRPGDQPSTSGMSDSMRKRKLGFTAEEGGKRLKKVDFSDESSSGDEVEGDRAGGRASRDSPSSSRSSRDESGAEGRIVLRNSEHQSLAAKLMAARDLIVREIPASEMFKRKLSGLFKKTGLESPSEVESKNEEPKEDKQSRKDPNASNMTRYRNMRPPPDRRIGVPRDSPTSQTARTQVYPCSCGSHSVIVVTADGAADGPSVHLQQNHAHPHLCEQQININGNQTLRVINRNEYGNGRPEVELVELNQNTKLKTSLRQLSFRGYHRVTNLTLNSIGHLNLDLLDLTYTMCTEQGILDFLRLNPNCRVLHKNFCVCRPRLDF